MPQDQKAQQKQQQPKQKQKQQPKAQEPKKKANTAKQTTTPTTPKISAKEKQAIALSTKVKDLLMSQKDRGLVRVEKALRKFINDPFETQIVSVATVESKRLVEQVEDIDRISTKLVQDMRKLGKDKTFDALDTMDWAIGTISMTMKKLATLGLAPRWIENSLADADKNRKNLFNSVTKGEEFTDTKLIAELNAFYDLKEKQFLEEIAIMEKRVAEDKARAEKNEAALEKAEEKQNEAKIKIRDIVKEKIKARREAEREAKAAEVAKAREAKAAKDAKAKETKNAKDK